MFTTPKPYNMDNQQLSEVLRHLIASLEATPSAADAESLRQAFYAGIRYQLDQTTEMELELDVNVDAHGDGDGTVLSLRISPTERFLKSYGDWNDQVPVKTEKYLESLNVDGIDNILRDLKLIA